MANPVVCSNCNMFLGNLYFLNSKINSSASHRKNKIFYIADDKSPYSYPYCQTCWASCVISNNLIRQKTEPAIEANYSLYLAEYLENAKNKKELLNKNATIDELNNNIALLTNELQRRGIIQTEPENTTELKNTIDEAIEKIKFLEEENQLFKEEVKVLEAEIKDKDEENTCSLNCLDLLKANFYRESQNNDKLREEIKFLKQIQQDNVHKENQMNDSIREEIKLLKQQHNDNISLIQSKYISTIVSLEDRISFLEDKIVTLEHVIDDDDDDIDAMKNVIINLEGKVSMYENTINNNINQIHSLKNTIKGTDAIIQTIHENNKTQTLKWKKYINDLNDYIEYNTVPKQTIQITADQNNHIVIDHDDWRSNSINENDNVQYDSFADNDDSGKYNDYYIPFENVIDSINENHYDSFVDNETVDDETNHFIEKELDDIITSLQLDKETYFPRKYTIIDNYI